MDKDLWYCDPYKNAECKKTGCFINGGPCMCTTNEKCAYELDGEKLRRVIPNGTFR